MAAHDIVMGAAGGSAAATYIEDVFSTYLYTGNGTARSISNGIDLSTNGGLTWIKGRNNSVGAFDHCWFDTARGATNFIRSNTTGAQSTSATSLTSFNSNGFSLGADVSGTVNYNNEPFVSWTFRKQPKFFDVVTYTGNGTAGRTIAHSLGSTPGCVIVHCTSTSDAWSTWHRSLTAGNYIQLQATNAQSTTNAKNIFGNGTTTVDPTSTVFTVGTDTAVNTNGATYVAYLFAHDAGGFGLTGADNVISCGITGGSRETLGWEPQWILHKATNFTSNWDVIDTSRGMPWGSQAQMLNPNLSNAEAVSRDTVNAQNYSPKIHPDGFELGTLVGNHIYIAIRRGPMKVPTDATKVFKPMTRTGTGTTTTVTGVGFPPDLTVIPYRTSSLGQDGPAWFDRLRGSLKWLKSAATGAEVAQTDTLTSFGMDGISLGADTSNYVINRSSGQTYVDYFLRRAPSFFDEVCYKGTNTAQTLTHNLGVAPEFIICKDRTAPDAWYCYSATLGNTVYIRLDSTAAVSAAGSQWWNNTSPTNTTFTAGTAVSTSPDNYVAYLFATCPGVSKVGTYTGNGSSQTINCGFAAGARFILIKCTSTTGDWYVWDTARGIVAGNDGHLSLNTTAAEVTTDDTIDPDSSGFIVNQLAATNVNVNAATYIYLAIA